MKTYLVAGRDDLRLETVLLGSAWKVKREVPEGAITLTREELMHACGAAWTGPFGVYVPERLRIRLARQVADHLFAGNVSEERTNGDEDESTSED